MPLTLDATLSGEESESYIDVAAANSYHEKRSGNTAWIALSSDDKIRALIGATDLLERLDYWGEPTVYNQALKFPRVYREASDGTSIPKTIQHALAELALHVSTPSNAASTSRRAAIRAAGVTSYRLGDLSETFGETGSAAVNGTAGTMAEMPAGVQRLIAGWVKSTHSSDSGRRHWSRDSKGLGWPDELTQ